MPVMNPNDERDLRIWAAELCGGDIARAAEVVRFVVGGKEVAPRLTLRAFVQEKYPLGWTPAVIAREYQRLTGRPAKANTVSATARHLGLSAQTPRRGMAGIAAIKAARAAKRNGAAHA